MRYDVVILGGGPAGSATALMLRAHAPTLSVAIVERSTYAQARIGETLPPQVQPLLTQLSVWDAFVGEGHAASCGNAAAWGSDTLHDNQFIFTPYGRGWHLDRRRFDEWLVHEAEQRRVTVFTGSRIVEQQISDDGWQLVMEDAGGTRQPLEASFVVDATGHRAAFARKQEARKILLDRLVGVVTFFDLNGAARQHDSRTLVEAWQDGWWYSAVLPENQLVVACMTDADLAKTQCLKKSEQWFARVAQTEHTRRRIDQARPCTDPIIYAAHSHRLDRFTGPSWLAVGDAASMVDPLSGQGIFKALRFGVMAAYAVSDYLRGEEAGLKKYAAVVAGTYDAYLEKRTDYYQKEQRWLEAPFWQRRVGRIMVDPQQASVLGPEGGQRPALKQPAIRLSASGYDSQ